jgi:hypothetical protein
VFRPASAACMASGPLTAGSLWTEHGRWPPHLTLVAGEPVAVLVDSLKAQMVVQGESELLRLTPPCALEDHHGPARSDPACTELGKCVCLLQCAPFL